MIEVYTFRHPQSQYNKEKRIQGQIDSPLSEEGLQQAQDIAERLKDTPFTVLLTSDLQRASTLAELVQRYHPQAQLVRDQDLRERGLGILEGKTYESYGGREADVFRIAIESGLEEGAEPLKALYARADNVPAKVQQYGNSAVVGVFSHGAFLARVAHAFSRQPFDPKTVQLLKNGQYHYFALEYGNLVEMRLFCSLPF